VALEPRNGSTSATKRSIWVIFRYHGKQHTLHLGSVPKTEAPAKSAQVDNLLMRLKQGLIEVSAGTDIVDFVEHDGKTPLTPALTLAPRFSRWPNSATATSQPMPLRMKTTRSEPQRFTSATFSRPSVRSFPYPISSRPTCSGTSTAVARRSSRP
jgi:hypothetical protein